jgi:hypothetical protein
MFPPLQKGGVFLNLKDWLTYNNHTNNGILEFKQKGI